MPVLNHPDGSPITSANPLPVSGSFSIASEIEIKNDAGSPVPVNGTVALDTATLAALENTSVTGNISVTNFPATQTVSVSNFPATQPISGSVSISNTPSVTVSNFPTTQPVSGTVAISGNVNTVQSGVGTAVGTPFYEAQVVAGAVVSVANPLPIIPSGSTLCVSGTTAAAAATVTLSAGATGTFHYIDSIEIVLFTSTARTASATPITITSTNLNTWGTLFPSVGALGAVDRFQLDTIRPLKSAVAATATTISLPAVTGGIWRYNVTYSLAV